jgi:hypothetical protein
VDEVTNALIAGISAKVKDLASNAELRLNTIAESATEQMDEAVSTLAHAGHTAAEEAARRASRLTAWPAVSLTLMLSAAALCVAFIGGVYYGLGTRAVEAQTHNALTAWALSPAGHEAYTFDQANSDVGGIRMFTRCSVPSWRIVERLGRKVCVAYPQKPEPASWRVLQARE